MNVEGHCADLENGEAEQAQRVRKRSATFGALPFSQCQGIPQSTSLPCLRDRMIDLLYLQMNS